MNSCCGKLGVGDEVAVGSLEWVMKLLRRAWSG